MFYGLIEYVNLILYLVLITITAYVIYWLVSADLKIRMVHYRYRLRIKRKQLDERKNEKERPKLVSHVYRMLYIRNSEADVTSAYMFIGIEVFLAVSVFIVSGIKFQDWFLPLFPAVISAAIPYLYLYVRVRTIQNKIGDSFIKIVETLVHSYSASQWDIYSALTMTHKQLEDKESQRMIGRLLSDLQTAHDESSLKEVIDMFIFTTGNSWGMRLGNIILKAYVYQENVNSALMTLQRQMIVHRKMLEEEKVGAADVSAQAILAVILFPVSLIGCHYIVQPQNWFVLQFSETTAFTSFVFTTLFVLIAALIGYIVKKPSSDL